MSYTKVSIGKNQHIAGKASSGESVCGVSLTNSRVEGEYLRTSGALEMYDVITGSPTQWFDLKILVNPDSLRRVTRSVFEQAGLRKQQLCFI